MKLWLQLLIKPSLDGTYVTHSGQRRGCLHHMFYIYLVVYYGLKKCK